MSVKLIINGFNDLLVSLTVVCNIIPYDPECAKDR